MRKFIGAVLLFVGGGSVALAASVGCTASPSTGYDPYGCASAYQNVVNTFNYFQPTTVSPTTTVNPVPSTTSTSTTVSTTPTVLTTSTPTQTTTSGASGLNMYGVGMDYSYAGGYASAPVQTPSGNVGAVSYAYAPPPSPTTSLVSTSVSTAQSTATTSLQYGYGMYGYVDYGSMMGYGGGTASGTGILTLNVVPTTTTTTTTTTAPALNLLSPTPGFPVDSAPEPGSVILVGTGLAALVLALRKRRRA